VFSSQRSLSSGWRETGQTSSTQERAALEWAETLTHISETHAPEEIYRDIAAHFTEKEMVDLTIAIGLMNVFNRIAIGSSAIPPPQDMRSSK
jgi:alkylhydroperoxidase family enzyme